MELTKEYFDQVVTGLATKGDLTALTDRIDGLADRIDALPTREEFKALESKIDEINTRLVETDQRDVQDSDAFAKDLVKHDRRITRLEKHLKLKAVS